MNSKSKYKWGSYFVLIPNHADAVVTKQKYPFGLSEIFVRLNGWSIKSACQHDFALW
ncbi:hypothetical protein QUF75_14090 [Desulfococcaceae bacterium HSG7]|nr:hypothetical protein [Desulfococcaceae bacterium HSG7]